MEKIDSRTLSLDALNERRRRAVKMRLEGTSLKDTAAQCEMSRTTVIAAVKAYEAGGWKAVDVDRGGRSVGSGRTLSAEQEREVQRLIRDRTPDQLKMVYALWTRQAVAELIRDRYGIKLAVRTTGLYLGRWGFTPQKPMKKAYEQSPAAVKKWLDEEYPVIAACAKVEGAESSCMSVDDSGVLPLGGFPVPAEEDVVKLHSRVIESTCLAMSGQEILGRAVAVARERRCLADSSARTDLWRGCRVTGIPTPTDLDGKGNAPSGDGSTSG